MGGEVTSKTGVCVRKCWKETFSFRASLGTPGSFIGTASLVNQRHTARDMSNRNGPSSLATQNGRGCKVRREVLRSIWIFTIHTHVKGCLKP